VLAPPSDWNELSACFESLPQIGFVYAEYGAAPGRYETGRHPILEGVRTDDTMGGSFRRLRGNWLLAGESDEEICAGRLEAADAPPLNDIIVRTFGEGRLIFVGYDPLASLGDPASDNLLRNLVDYAGRRAVPGEKPPPFQRAIEKWNARAKPLMRWHVLGPFRTDTALPAPPAHKDDLVGTFDGAYGPVEWQRWWNVYGDECAFDLAAACQPNTNNMFGNAGLIGYAAHTFRTTAREPKSIRVVSRQTIRVWFNGRLLGSNAEKPDGALAAEVTTREGVNTVVVESSGGETDWSFLFSLDGG